MEQSKSELNPYRPTLERLEESETVVAVDFGPILRRWERFRLVYNGVLVTLTLVLSVIISPALLFQLPHWLALAVAGLFANLCFFTGPAIEAYGRYFRLWHIAMSYGLFLLGLLFTCAMATLFVFNVAR